MDYSREYGLLHQQNKTLSGYSLKHYVKDVVELVELRGRPESILDYGSGKGYQYLQRRFHEKWGGPLPHCFDVGVPQLAERPERKFDALICTDVLEHIEKSDIPRFLDDMLSFIEDTTVQPFVLLTASCYPAKRKTLSDKRNVHVTVEPPEWWSGMVNEALERRGHPNQLFARLVCATKQEKVRTDFLC